MRIFKRGFIWLRATVPKLIPDILALTGAVAITYGMSLIYLPIGWVVGGIMAIVAAVVWSKGGGLE